MKLYKEYGLTEDEIDEIVVFLQDNGDTQLQSQFIDNYFAFVQTHELRLNKALLWFILDLVAEK